MNAEEVKAMREKMTSPEKLVNCPYCVKPFPYFVLEGNHMPNCAENPKNKPKEYDRYIPQSERETPQNKDEVTPQTAETARVKAMQEKEIKPLSFNGLRELYNNKLTEEQIESCKCRQCGEYFDPNDIMNHEDTHK